MTQLNIASERSSARTVVDTLRELERLGPADSGIAAMCREGAPDASHLEFLAARQGGWGLRRNGVTLDSAYAPKRQAAEIVEAEDYDGVEAVVVFGCGGGSLPAAALEVTRGLDLRVIVLEPDPAVLFGALSREESLSGRADGRLSLFTSVQSLKMHLVQSWADKGRLLIVCPAAYRRQYPELCAGLPGEIEEAMRLARINTNTVDFRARQWVNNLLLNLSARTQDPSFFALEGALEGVPAVIVSAGPSLDSNVDLLKGLEDRVLIVCVNTSLKAVLAAGVRPHIVICLESLDVSTHFQGLERELAQTALVLEQTSHPKLYDIEAGCRFTFFGGSQRQLDFSAKALKLDTVRGLPSGGSIANTAFSAVDLLGCSPIVLIGQDLAYTDGQVYASKTVFGGITMDKGADGLGRMVDPAGLKQKILDDSEVCDDAKTFRSQRQLFPVRSWEGQGEVMTSTDFNLFRLWFQEAGQKLRARRSVRLINATQGGAYIEGFEHVGLEAVLEESVRHRSRRDLRALIEDVWRDAPRVPMSRWQQGISEAVVECSAVVRCVALARARLKRAEGALASRGPDSLPFRKAISALHEAEEKVGVACRRSPLVDLYVRAAMKDLIQAAPEDDEGAGLRHRWAQNLRHSDGINSVIGCAASELLDELRRTCDEAMRGHARGHLG